MILSFHPCIEGDKNILCAGRDPGPQDLAAIQSADAVLLPQGCTAPLYDMVCRCGKPHFPDYGMRFRYPGKTGQIELFRNLGVHHPRTIIFRDLASFQEQFGGPENPPFDFPFVFKFDWGGEGHTVFLIDSVPSFLEILRTTADFERTGFKGFLIQKLVSAGGRSLRVVVIGKKIISYWRVQRSDEAFYASIARGASIDAASDLPLQRAAVSLIKNFCRDTGINLAGFDLLFPSTEANPQALLLEINYFFGRDGLGGSEAYYGLLEREIKIWMKALGLPGKPLT
jgi:ribosomal protein S6--L-glutamate ligase